MFTYVSDLPHYRNFIQIFFLVCCLKPIQTLALQKIGSKVKSCLTTSLTILITLSISSVGACHQFSYQQHIVGDTRSIVSVYRLYLAHATGHISVLSNELFVKSLWLLLLSYQLFSMSYRLHSAQWNPFYHLQQLWSRTHSSEKIFSENSKFVENTYTVILLWLISHRKVAK